MSTSDKPKTDKKFKPAVEIHNGFKYYGIFNKSQIVLQTFNLIAYPGELYVLLGPRGCGKSTVLNIILGFSRLTQGRVEVFGFKPGTRGSGIPGMRVGYTPNSQGLYENFTVTETIGYYGALLGLKQAYINERMASLDILLSLPAGGTYIRNCPESMKRKVSFAIAILHEPELLVLDEPTVGVDPLHAKSIWSYLKQLTNKTKTIIVSTTIVSEAQAAHRIGIMRSGCLLLEGRPRFLRDHFNENSVEELYCKAYTMNFLHSLKADGDDSDNSTATLPGVIIGEYFVDDQPARFYEEELNSSHLFRTVSGSKMFNVLNDSCLKHMCPRPRRVVALVLYNLLRIVRSYGLIFLYFLIPMLMMFCFSLFIGGMPVDLEVGVINHEADASTCRKHKLDYASCIFLSYFEERGIKLIHYKNRNYTNKPLLGELKIGKKFSEIFYENTENSTQYTDCGLENENSCLALTLDEADRVLANQIIYYAIGACRDLEKDIMPGNTAVKLIDFNVPFYGASRNSEKLVMLPGLLVLWTFYSSMILGPLIVLIDRHRNCLIRGYLAGVKTIEVIIAQLLSYGFLIHIQSFFLALVTIYYENYFYKTHCYEIIFILVPLVLCGNALGLLGIAIFRNKLYFGIFTVACLWISMLISGLLWTPYAAPSAFKPVMRYTPHHCAGEEIRRNLLKNASFKSTKFHSSWILLAWTCIFWLLFVIVRQIYPD